MSQPDSWLDAFLAREAETIQHMGPRERAKLIAFASYHLPAAERVLILAGVGKLQMPRLAVLKVWGDIAGIEFGVRRLAA